MSDLTDLYQEVILDHSKKPRNFHSLPQANRTAEGHNPLCGDRIALFVKCTGDCVTDISFQGSGCAISTASASIMTETVKGKSRAEAETLLEQFHSMLTREQPLRPDLGKLEVFAGVREFPARVKCATLAWHTLRAALNGSAELVSTE